MFSSPCTYYLFIYLFIIIITEIQSNNNILNVKLKLKKLVFHHKI